MLLKGMFPMLSFRRYICLCLLFVLLPVWGAFGQTERITNYNVKIDVQKDSSLLVTEEISVVAAGNSIKRGIYRDFPTNYKDRIGVRYRVGFDVLEVLKDGQAEPYRVTSHANGKRVYIGSKNVFLTPGPYTYTLRYKTTFQVGFFKDHDELYFNAIGHGWIFPIDAASVSVTLPEGISYSDITVDGFTGPQGSTQKDFYVETLTDSFVSLQLSVGLREREGFTIVVMWPEYRPFALPLFEQ